MQLKQYQAKGLERLDQYLETLGEHRDRLEKINRLLVKEGDKPESGQPERYSRTNTPAGCATHARRWTLSSVESLSSTAVSPQVKRPNVSFAPVLTDWAPGGSPTSRTVACPAGWPRDGASQTSATWHELISHPSGSRGGPDSQTSDVGTIGRPGPPPGRGVFVSGSV